jgi:hypothetical protein
MISIVNQVELEFSKVFLLQLFLLLILYLTLSKLLTRKQQRCKSKEPLKHLSIFLYNKRVFFDIRDERIDPEGLQLINLSRL